MKAERMHICRLRVKRPQVHTTEGCMTAEPWGGCKYQKRTHMPHRTPPSRARTRPRPPARPWGSPRCRTRTRCTPPWRTSSRRAKRGSRNRCSPKSQYAFPRFATTCHPLANTSSPPTRERWCPPLAQEVEQPQVHDHHLNKKKSPARTRRSAAHFQL